MTAQATPAAPALKAPADLLAVATAAQAAIDAIRANHNGIPPIALVIGASGKGRAHGWTAPGAWETKDGQRVTEIALAGESFSRGGRDTLGTLIHELAHAYAHANKITDTSNHGRYHNGKFREIAESFGIRVEQAGTIGWSATSVPTPTAVRYAKEIHALDDAITAYRAGGYSIQPIEPTHAASAIYNGPNSGYPKHWGSHWSRLWVPEDVTLGAIGNDAGANRKNRVYEAGCPECGDFIRVPASFALSVAPHTECQDASHEGYGVHWEVRER